MNSNIYRPMAVLALFAAAVLAAGLMAMVGAKPAWAELNFTQAQNYPVGPYPTDLTAADFDGDGNAADLAVAIPNSTTADTLGNVAVLSNEGDGTFAAARNVTAGNSPLSVTSADFDRDGKEDLAVANGSSNVSISLSNGDGTFQAAKYFPVGGGAVQVTTGHFNDDGAADLATADDPYNPASGSIADSVSVLLGNGDGTFKDAWPLVLPVGPDNHTNPQQVVSADFDGDGKADLAVANHGGGDFGGSGCCNRGYVRVLLSDGDGTFSEGQYLGTAPGMFRPDSLATADFDQDGNADLAIAQETNPNRGVVAVWSGNGDGSFNPAGAFTADYYPTFVIAEDLNDDNYPDLAVANREAFDTGDHSRKVSVLLNIPPPGATTSTSGPSGTVSALQPSFQLTSSETNPGLVGGSAAAAGNTTRISVDASGAQLNTSSSGSASISSGGRYVVFTSTSPDLVPNDTNNRIDVFVRDLTTGTTRRMSVDSSGNQGDDTSLAPSISSDGRFVAFSSRATNLVPNDTNTVPGSSFGQDFFVRDRDTDADGIFDEPGFVSTERVNVSSSGAQANNVDGGTPRPSISSDGRFVAFTSRATNLVPNDTNGAYDVFVRDRTMGTTQRVSVSSSGTQADRGGFGPSISSDGRYVAFTSRATNLVSGDTNGAEDVFVSDLTTGTTRRVSVDISGNQVNGACNEFACEGSSVVSISSNGRYVAFNSAAFNLVANDTNDLNDIFVRDRDTDADGVFDETGAASTERVNVTGCATQANRGGFSPFISSDGSYVTFNSQSTNLVANDTNVSPDFFVRDRTMGTTQRVSVGSSGTQSHLGGGGSSITSDGRFAVFSSQALDLVANDTNGFTDVFLRESGDAPPPSSDCIAPTTTTSASTDSGAAYTSGTWANEDVQVSLSAQDNEGGSGVKEITYSLNGGAKQTYNSANKIPVTTEGTTTISYFATDNVGNQESPAKTFVVKMDKSAPQITPADVVSNVWRNSSLSKQFTASDSGGSGLANSADASFTLTASAQSASAAQPTEVSRTVSDVAGNSTTRRVSALIDLSDPQVTASLSSQPNAAGWYKENVTLSLSVTDNPSGVKEISYSRNGGAPTTVQQSSVEIPITAEGETTISYSARDNAGRTAAEETVTVKLDKSAPTVVGFAPVGKKPTGGGWERGIDITAALSEEIDQSTLSAQTIKLINTATGKRVGSVAIRYNETTKTVTLDPSTSLAKNTKYKVSVTTGVEDMAGNPIDQNPSVSGNQPKSWTFTTGSI